MNNASAPVALVHLSDFHFRDGKHPILDHADAIVSSVRSLLQPVSALFVVVTGDIAYSGLPEEYKLADAFFRDLAEGLRQAFPGAEITILFTPGNHDCDLKSPPDVRDFSILRTKRKWPPLSRPFFACAYRKPRIG